MNKIKTYKVHIYLTTIMLLIISKSAYAETTTLNAIIERFPPAVFSKLPKNIQRSLETRGCAIPQAYDIQQPHNVLYGEFIKKGQKDWAVLCSKDNISTILIFMDGSVEKVNEIAARADENYLQSYGEEYDAQKSAFVSKYGFSREIMIVGKKQILQYNKNLKELCGEEKSLPPITHDGIDDIFVNKASIVHYYYKGQWLELAGSD